jgi:hypothetical protein
MYTYTYGNKMRQIGCWLFQRQDPAKPAANLVKVIARARVEIDMGDESFYVPVLNFKAF